LKSFCANTTERSQSAAFGTSVFRRLSIGQRILFLNLFGIFLLFAAILYLENSGRSYVALEIAESQLFGTILANVPVHCRRQDGADSQDCAIDETRVRRLIEEHAREHETYIAFIGANGALLHDNAEFDSTSEQEGAAGTAGAEDLTQGWKLTFSRWIDATISYFSDAPGSRIFVKPPRRPVDFEGAAGNAPTAAGETERSTPFGRTYWDEVFEALQGTRSGAHRRTVNKDGRYVSVITSATPIHGPEGRIHGAVLIASITPNVDAAIADGRIHILLLLFAGLAVNSAMGICMATSIARPLAQLADHVNAIADHRMPLDALAVEKFRTLSARQDNEIGILAHAFTAMLDSIRNRIDQIKHDATTLTHQTGTNLGTVLSHAETLELVHSGKAQLRLSDAEMKAIINSMIDAVQQASSRTHMILDQATQEVALETAARERFDLSEVARAVIEERSESARQLGVKIKRDLPPSAPVHGHPGAIQATLAEILANALSFARARPGEFEAEVRVRLQAAESRRPGVRPRRAPTGWLTLTVENFGNEIPPSLLPVIFEPGKSSRAGKGAHGGWGLWQVRRTIDLVGGRVGVESIPEPGTDGATTRFILQLA